MNDTSCPACGSTFDDGANRLVPYAGSGTFLGEMPRQIRICVACGFGMAAPMPSDDALRRFYSGSLYWSHDDADIADVRNNAGQAALAFARWRLLEDVLGQSGKSAALNVLDIGAGNGFVAAAAIRSERIHLASYVAVEPDLRVGNALANGAPRLAPQISCGVVADLSQAPVGMDLAIASHVLEHVREPRAFLEEMIAHVRPGGILFIDVPHLDYRFKADVFPHLLFFSHPSLRYLAEACGLEVLASAVYGRAWTGRVAGTNERLAVLLRRFLNRGRRVVPVSWLLAFYDWDLGASMQNPDGPWIRLVARKRAA